MDTIAGYQKTGRVTIGPGADLVELSSENGFRHTAVAFHPPYRAHPAIGPGLEVVKGFLEAPYVTGLLELVAHDPKQGAFVYPTGQAWSAYEVVRTLSDLGQNAGIRAGLELMYTAGEILLNAAEAGEPAGVYSHGGLTPWRVMVKADGQVEIMGYALPQVEILQFQANNNEVPGEDSFRYCPPERMVSTKEDVSADLFALSLVAFELMTGKPVYDGLVNDIRTQASRGEGTRRLFRFKDQLPNGVRDLLNLCLKPSPRDRFPDGASYLRAVQKVLSSAEASGPSLMDTMSRVSKTQRRTGESLDAGKTQSLSKADLARILAEQDNEPEPPRPARPAQAKGAAWTPPAKGKAAEPAPAAKATPAAEVKAATPPRAEPPKAAPPPQTPSDSRWGRPAEGRRARAPRTTRPGEVGDEEEELDGPAPMGGSPPPAAAAPPAEAPRSRISADELIRSISSSTDGGLRRALNRSQSSASSVIDAILSDATPKRAEAAGPEPLPSTPEGGLGVRRAPPRARAPLPSFDDPPPEVRRPEPSRPEPAPPPRVVEPRRRRGWSSLRRRPARPIR
ncbi:MAG: hypothetical protein IPN01_28455 [Deltaproteobacteria bacterium]|nr:hypothetical protein [Deltaproteobacteria bacterium]